MTKTLMAHALLLVLPTGIVLFLLEFGIRLFFPQPLNYYNFTLIQAEGGGAMVTGKSVSVRQARPTGYGPYVPHLSTNFGAVAVKINSRGWRDTEHSLDKPEGVTRIMVVGDSVTFGYGVRLEDMFSKVLERKLNANGIGRYDVISLGGAGANTYAQKEMMKENVRTYAPDLVILAFNLNDILPNIIERSVKSHDRRRFVAQTSLQLRKTLDKTFRSRSHLYFLIRESMKVLLRRFAIASPTMVPLAAFDIESDYGMAAWQQTGDALLDIAAQLEKEHVRFLLAILPVDIQLSPEVAAIYREEYGFKFSDSLVNGRPQERIKAFAKQHGIPCVDLLPAFRKRPEDKKFFRIYGGSIDWNHPNPLGHGIIAEELTKALAASAHVANANGRAARRSLAALETTE